YGRAVHHPRRPTALLGSRAAVGRRGLSPARPESATGSAHLVGIAPASAGRIPALTLSWEAQWQKRHRPRRPRLRTLNGRLGAGRRGARSSDGRPPQLTTSSVAPGSRPPAPPIRSP